jgi:hypothetical protein
MSRGNALLVIERILRDRDGIWRQIGEERQLGRLTGEMLITSVLAFAVFGAVLGASKSFPQVLSSAIKLPLLFLITLAICLPTLYLFNLVFGARLQVRQALALVLVTITVTAVLSLAFAPISLFFLITASHYSFYKLLNVAILALAAVVGLRFLTSGMTALNSQMARAAGQRRAELLATQSEDEAMARAAALDGAVPQAATIDEVEVAPVPQTVPASETSTSVYSAALPNGQHQLAGNQPQLLDAPTHPTHVPPPYPAMPRQARPELPPVERPASMTLLYVWIMLFGFVGTQLAWTLRPFVGSPDRPFEIFREIDGNFYVDIVRTLGGLF